MRDRLIELIDDFIHTEDVKRWYSAELDEQLADHLLANGVIVPPCKVGDTLYVVYKWYEKRVYPVSVSAIRMDTKKNSNRICVWGSFRVRDNYVYEYKSTFKFDSVGKTVFLTKEEAEAALKGGAE